MANPTGCSIALESIKILQEPEIQYNIQRINKKHLAFAEKIKKHHKVQSTRVLGVIFALDLKLKDTDGYYGKVRNILYDYFIENGIILRPVYGTIYILPCYIMTDKQLDKVYKTIEEAIQMLEDKQLL